MANDFLSLYRVQIAEWAIGAWLAHAHNFKIFMAQQDNEEWNMRLNMADSTTDSPGLRMYVS